MRGPLLISCCALFLIRDVRTIASIEEPKATRNDEKGVSVASESNSSTSIGRRLKDSTGTIVDLLGEATRRKAGLSRDGKTRRDYKGATRRYVNSRRRVGGRRCSCRRGSGRRMKPFEGRKKLREKSADHENNGGIERSKKNPYVESTAIEGTVTTGNATFTIATVQVGNKSVKSTAPGITSSTDKEFMYSTAELRNDSATEKRDTTKDESKRNNHVESRTAAAIRETTPSGKTDFASTTVQFRINSVDDKDNADVVESRNSTYDETAATITPGITSSRNEVFMDSTIKLRNKSSNDESDVIVNGSRRDEHIESTTDKTIFKTASTKNMAFTSTTLQFRNNNVDGGDKAYGNESSNSPHDESIMVTITPGIISSRNEEFVDSTVQFRNHSANDKKDAIIEKSRRNNHVEFTTADAISETTSSRNMGLASTMAESTVIFSTTVKPIVTSITTMIEASTIGTTVANTPETSGTRFTVTQGYMESRSSSETTARTIANDSIVQSTTTKKIGSLATLKPQGEILKAGVPRSKIKGKKGRRRKCKKRRKILRAADSKSKKNHRSDYQNYFRADFRDANGATSKKSVESPKDIDLELIMD